MVKKAEKLPADYIHPLNMNGLKGRMLYMPAATNKKREILFVYGHHSSLERWWGVIQDLNQYGAITMPDLPGFGGMDSFYKIGEKPTIDNMADYLASFIKLRYKRKKITIAGLSFGFVVATRMLQKYPDLVNKVDLLVSVVGFAHYEDFTFTKPRYNFYKYASKFLSYRIPALVFRGIGLNPLVLRTIYRHTHNAKNKFKNVDSKEELKKLLDFEVYLWHANEMRTHWSTTAEFLRLNNCTKQVDAPVWHIAVSGDQYFNNDHVEQHYRVIFNDFHMAVSEMDSHAPSIIATASEAAPLFPKNFRRVLSKK